MGLNGYLNSLCTISHPYAGPIYIGAPTPKYVGYRNDILPRNQVPECTPLPENITPTGSGRFRDALNLSTWNTCVNNAQPGDVIRIINSIPRNLTARGTKYNLPGGTAVDGTEEDPITVISVDDSWIDPGDVSNGYNGLEIAGLDHWNVVGVNVKNSQNGIALINVEGTESYPVRVARCKVQNIGRAGIIFKGWWQPVVASNGVAPIGDGNSYGYSKYILCEKNDITLVGRSSSADGIGIELGLKGTPGWISYANEFIIRYNEISHFTSSGISPWPGCRNFAIHDNIIRSGAAHDGAPLNLCYMVSDIDSKPGWMPGDILGYVEGNRVFDLNISETTDISNDYMCMMGMSGLRIANNLFWAYPDGVSPYNPAIVKQAPKVGTPALADYGTATTWLRNNLYWGKGYEDLGYGTFGTPWVWGSFSRINDIYASGYSGGQHAATSGDFDGALEAVGYIDGADNNGWGYGSSFDLADLSPLVGAGTAFTVADLFIERDISQRIIPASTPNPGPFQSYL